jgi:hypothetical protein
MTTFVGYRIDDEGCVDSASRFIASIDKTANAGGNSAELTLPVNRQHSESTAFAWAVA